MSSVPSPSPAPASPPPASTAVVVPAASAPPTGTATSAALVLADLESFEVLLQQQLVGVGLPVNRVFVDVAERHAMLSNIGAILSPLDADILARSHYVSKMIAAATVGPRRGAALLGTRRD